MQVYYVKVKCYIRTDFAIRQLALEHSGVRIRVAQTLQHRGGGFGNDQCRTHRDVPVAFRAFGMDFKWHLQREAVMNIPCTCTHMQPEMEWDIQSQTHKNTHTHMHTHAQTHTNRLANKLAFSTITHVITQAASHHTDRVFKVHAKLLNNHLSVSFCCVAHSSDTTSMIQHTATHDGPIHN